MQVLEFGVRDFLNIALKSGGLSAEFSPRDRASAGVAAHLGATSNRPEGYQREMPVVHSFEWQSFRIVVRGRIDGLLHDKSGTIVEEIKSTFLPLHLLNADHNFYHVAQLRLYHYFACRRFPDESIIPTLTYVHPFTLEERSFTFAWSVEESQAFFEDLAIRLLEREVEKRRWRALRDKSIRQLSFPFNTLRQGQSELLAEVERAINSQQDLLVEAPTGIGKTMAVLFPAIRLLDGRHGYSRIFYLTAKSAGADVVRKSIDMLRDQGMHLRVLYLTAKERMCPLAGANRPECAEGECPYADDFFTKAEVVIPQILQHQDLTPELIQETAERETLCPFELSLELSLLADLIVCDYNYAFDPSVYLRRFFQNGLLNDNLFLIDEAHNLVPRGREMYSASLKAEDLEGIRDHFCQHGDALFDCLQPIIERYSSWRESLEFEGMGASILPELPEGLLKYIDGTLDLTSELLMTMPKGDRRTELLEFYFELHHFSSIAMGLSAEYAVYVAADRKATSLNLSCLNPGPLLRQRMQGSVAAIFLSATLSPSCYFIELLGVRDGGSHFTLPSPFPSENRLYLHVPEVSTKYVSREETKLTVAQVIMDVVRANPGNYLAFFPSYAYQGTVWAEIMITRPSDLHVYAQQPNMNTRMQEEFLHKVCSEGGERANIGLAVMGGLFGEAVDLPGDRLIGVIIVGPGLPAISPRQELIREYFDEEHNNEGFFYAYVVPGVIRVIQAAGRVFRSPDDRGIVVLMDDRFLEEPYRQLLPADWSAESEEFSTHEYISSLKDFWGAS